MYDHLFGDRCPVAEPGTETGTAGDWWTVVANSPAVMEHCVAGFLLYQDPARQLDPVLREVAQCRVGVAAGSGFVAGQHRRALLELGVDPLVVAAVAGESSAADLPDAVRLVVAFVDALVARLGDVPSATFDPIAAMLGDEAMLELTYITSTYLLHSVLSRALRTEEDAVLDQ
jgi:alkylhydroperoxidase family enzyme